MSVDLSKLLALETALEYMSKATLGEKLEYLKPGEKAPGDTKIHTTPRGAKGYYPSEVSRKKEAEPSAKLAPDEEKEIEVVQAPEIKTESASEYPKSVFDSTTEQYLNIVVPEDSKVYGIEAGIHRLSQPHGAPVRGTPISLDDSRIPDTVYHMTTNAPAVRESKKLIAGGVGGLGGDDRDKIVSLTINKEIAHQLADDTKLASEISRMGGGKYKSSERIEESRAIIKRLIQEMEKEGWDSPRFREYDDNHFEYMHESYNPKEWLSQYFSVRARATSNLGKEKRNPLFFTDSEVLAKVNPENIDVIEIPKSALRTGAMLTDLDLDNPYGLQEIRIYGDIPIEATIDPKRSTDKASSYKMPKYDMSWEALVEAEFKNKELNFISITDKMRTTGYISNLIEDTDNVVLRIGNSIYFGESEDDVKDKVLKEYTEGKYGSSYHPPRLTPKPEWATDENNPFPDIPSDIKEIHYDDIPEFYKKHKYGDALQQFSSLKGISRKISKVAGMHSEPFYEALECVDGDLDYEHTADVFSQELEESVTEKQAKLALNRLRDMTQKSLKHRGLPEKFYVFRGGKIHNEDRPMPTSLSAATAAESYFSQKGGEPYVAMYEVNRNDVLLDMNSMKSEAQGEEELIILGRNLKNPRMIRLSNQMVTNPEFHKSKSNNLLKLLALETAIEVLLKVNPNEELEYIDSESELPEDTRLVRTRRGAIGYYPSEKGQQPTSDQMRDDVRGEQDVPIDRPELEPDDEWEISAVTAPASPESTSDEVVDHTDRLPNTDEFDWFSEHSEMKSPHQINSYFEEVSLSLDSHLQQTKGSDFKSFLGKGINPARLSIDNATKAGYTNGSIEGTGMPPGLGINSLSNWTMTIDDKPFIYKLVYGENQAEIFSYSIDRALGLNIVPYNKQHSIDVDVLKSLIERTHNVDDSIKDFDMDIHADVGRGNKAGGHFQEFCTNCLEREDHRQAIGKMLSSEEGREEFFKIILLDFITGNDDRHSGNYLITDEHKIVAIDNGFAGYGRAHQAHQEMKSVNLLEHDNLWIRRLEMVFPFGVAGVLRNEVGYERVSEIADPQALEREAEAVFDKYFTPANKNILNKALRMSKWQIKVGEGRVSDFAKLKNQFVSHAASNLQRGIIGYGTAMDSIPEESEPMGQTTAEKVFFSIDENALEEAGLEDVSLGNR